MVDRVTIPHPREPWPGNPSDPWRQDAGNAPTQDTTGRWQDTTAELAAVAEPPSRRPLALIGLSLVAVALVVLGGLWAVGAFSSSGTSSGPDAGPALVQPSTTTETTLPVIIFTTDPGASGSTGGTPVGEPTKTKKPKPTQPVASSPKPGPTKTKPSADPTTTAGPIVGVRQGGPCNLEGAFGLTTKGVLVQCRTSPPDDRLRWRKV